MVRGIDVHQELERYASASPACSVWLSVWENVDMETSLDFQNSSIKVQFQPATECLKVYMRSAAGTFTKELDPRDAVRLLMFLDSWYWRSDNRKDLK